MNVAALSPVGKQGARPVSRATTRPAPTDFSRVLHAASPSRTRSSRATHTVLSGETLWGICAARLRRGGHQPSNQATQEAVMAVARTNRLADPDVIQAGQVLDLPPLGRAGATSRRGTAKSVRRPEASAVSPLVSRPGVGGKAAATIRTNEDLAALLRGLLAEKYGGDAGTSGPWNRIVKGPVRLSSGFGVRKDPFTGRRQHHAGVDLAVPVGTRVHPMGSGRVVFSGSKGGYGNVVIVRHDNGVETAYGHNKTNLVRIGQRVTRHTPLALSGSTGRSTGPHLHFEVRVAGRAVDPMPFLTRDSLQIAQAL